MSLRLALAKGRGASSYIQLLSDGGIATPRTFQSSRLSVFYSEAADVWCFWVRGKDLTKLLDAGYVDAIIGSSVHLEEHGGQGIVQVAALPTGHCRLSLITKDERPLGTLQRICTRFPQATRRLLKGVGSDVRIIEMAGCNEVSFFVGLGDAIVDIIETGWTIQELSLMERETLCLVHDAIWVRQDQLAVLEKLQRVLPSASWQYRVELLK